MIPHEFAFCLRCGGATTTKLEGAKGCPKCRNHRFSYDVVVPLGTYGGELREAILRMKRVHAEGLSENMGRLYALYRATDLAKFQPELAVPVPMHWTRRMARGTNSATVLAKQLARTMLLPLNPHLLVRCRKTLPQADLPPGRRFENVRGAFRVKAGYDIEGKRVVLVDDVLTTGATCGEAAKVLKQAGAKKVLVAVLARAEGPQSR